ncbi:hypothetical protein C1H46_021727 [Malus baccata]|uniref:Uncharacterized protein n=1 Tax=Malus baccata TaxID=106549 RepID=A0A540M1Q1_MALBA|nr:hypothetical protein C1H46_021727 [Malus baccata]
MVGDAKVLRSTKDRREKGKKKGGSRRSGRGKGGWKLGSGDEGERLGGGEALEEGRRGCRHPSQSKGPVAKTFAELGFLVAEGERRLLAITFL